MVHNLTKKQQTALDYAFRKGGAVYMPGRNTGGAIRRMCERLAADWYLEDRPPFPIAAKGLEALLHIRRKRFAKSGCMAYLDDLKAVEAAIENYPVLAARLRKEGAL